MIIPVERREKRPVRETRIETRRIEQVDTKMDILLGKEGSRRKERSATLEKEPKFC